ncbi:MULTISPECIES: heme o synthase [Acinetobacter]|uniref:Protoheme IX farnesyltransferase n=1 Tax=Acinetobacter pittii (strain PHEA-2) TaxID=871585 RepID=F0KHU9_ACIP2|nr:MULTISPECIES: heme o synthase [Acinetobacter]YP_004995926.1 protoheme IX farnesyltransferase (heme O biosynthesis) [Acinetobacter pittii PHEA-2]ADY82244.1 protoheme IX farnesyltransferase (heme O biosynthesis) [Acinetobacter pittii PHEA-2]AUM25754.1 protoheme IX farnesyltransferase [Acinetobacter pittii]MBJ8431946.1 protoheme IX farnesyltransferase [Acinetobacter pittii]MCE6235780.1 heme o synthase [Acinetobacter pittii]MCE6691019.1 heme o synthase [Acinetobacter pittii]
MLRKYLFLTKPGILFGNFITTLGGFFLAAQGSIDILLLLLTLLGTTLVVASGCVVNNVIDQDIDTKMQRTQNRALVKKTISPTVALIYALVLGIIGFSILWFGVNGYAFLFAMIGFIVYVGFYSLWTKRTSIHQTVIGSISGASPPVIGYTAVTHQFDVAALLLFLAYALWQMPHSWAIAIYRFDDYKNAGIPILPVARSIYRTKIECVIYILLFAAVLNGLYCFGYTNVFFLITFNALTAYWLYLSVIGFKAENDQLWAKRFFLYSVILITLLSLSFSFTYQSPAPNLPLF